MQPISRDDIKTNEEYAKIRAQMREDLLQIKEHRRVLVGTYLNFLFENRDTMIYQVQEMMRVERIEEEAAIAHEIETYNQLVPGDHELKATLLIEFEDEQVRRVKLQELVGLQEHIKMVIDGGHETGAIFDHAQIETDKLSSVQYITFPLGAEAASALKNASSVEIVTTHPACSYRQPLEPEQLAAIRDDVSVSGV